MTGLSQTRDTIDTFTTFEDTISNLAALAQMVGAAMPETADNRGISYTVEKFFMREIAELRVIYAAFHSEIEQMAAARKSQGAGGNPSQEPEKVKPTAIRDRFVMEAHGDGYSSADISMALGLPQGAVLRIIGRLAGSEQERRKAV